MGRHHLFLNHKYSSLSQVAEGLTECYFHLQLPHSSCRHWSKKSSVPSITKGHKTLRRSTSIACNSFHMFLISLSSKIYIFNHIWSSDLYFPSQSHWALKNGSLSHLCSSVRDQQTLQSSFPLPIPISSPLFPPLSSFSFTQVLQTISSTTQHTTILH